MRSRVRASPGAAGLQEASGRAGCAWEEDWKRDEEEAVSSPVRLFLLEET